MRSLAASLALPLLALAACDSVNEPHQLAPLTDDPELTLYVSNQSFDIDPVDIDVFIDGEPAVTGDFLVEGQHSWHEFPFDAALGAHEIMAVSSQAPSPVTASLDLGKPEHVVISFWYYPAGDPEPYGPTLSLEVYDEPPLFD